MSVSLYSLEKPYDDSFAQAIRLGTWYPNPGPGLCPECTDSRQRRVAPLIIEWQAGSDLIGDFTWATAELIVAQHVREALEARFGDFEFFAIEMYQSPKLKRPEQARRRTQRRVWLPYDGPALWELNTPVWCSLDLERSQVTIERVCKTCGKTFYNLPPRWNRHFVIDPATWRGQQVFHLRESPGEIFVTMEVKQFIESLGFTNVRFSSVGEMPD